MKNKLLILTGTFLLLVPFRLPMSVLLINLFNYTAMLSGGEIPIEVLRGNVVVSKLVYAVAFSIIFTVKLRSVLRDIPYFLGERKKEGYYDEEDNYRYTYTEKMTEGGFWLLGLNISAWVCYSIYDAVTTGLIFDMLNK